MNPDPSEYSETGNRPTLLPLEIETSDLPTNGGPNGRRPVLESFSHRVVNRRREKIWHERCEPGHMPCLNLPSAAVGFVVGMGCAIFLGAFSRTVTTDAAVSNSETPPSHFVEALMNDDDVFENEDTGFMMSEAGMDHYAKAHAEKLRHETERRIAQIDEIMVWRLDDWRQPLSTLQDMTVQLAGVGTGGGTWVGHEMQRNDLLLESDLLGPYAEALSADTSTAPFPKPVDLEATRKRAKAWQSVWTEFESTAHNLRESPETDDIWKYHLDSTLKEALKAHDLLALMLGNLQQEEAAQAVIDFCTSYLVTTTGMFLDSDPKAGH